MEIEVQRRVVKQLKSFKEGRTVNGNILKASSVGAHASAQAMAFVREQSRGQAKAAQQLRIRRYKG